MTMRWMAGLAGLLLLGCTFDKSGLPPSPDTHHGGDLRRDLPPPPLTDGPLLSDGLECGQVCAGNADRCEQGKCVCGAGGKCQGGLSCVAGSCHCVPGANSLCDGCCENDVCIAFAFQYLVRCGQGGGPCVSCDDQTPCTTDTCLPSGVCQSAPDPNGTPCDDGKYCSVNDKCQAGQCRGTPKQCTTYQTCKVSECSEQANTCVIENAPDGKSCYVTGKCKNGDCAWY